jgi:hypothetical protein
MFVLEIRETQMQIEMNDHAARLRWKRIAITCVHPPAAQRVELDGCDHDSAAECHDCGDCLICCHCRPGEG